MDFFADQILCPCPRPRLALFVRNSFLEPSYAKTVITQKFEIKLERPMKKSIFTRFFAGMHLDVRFGFREIAVNSAVDYAWLAGTKLR